jgi:hypothetical protein
MRKHFAWQLAVLSNHLRHIPGSAKANGREPKSCSGRIFNFKLGCFVMCTIARPIQVQLSLEWKTQSSFCPVSLSLSMHIQKNVKPSDGRKENAQIKIQKFINVSNFQFYVGIEHICSCNTLSKCHYLHLNLDGYFEQAPTLFSWPY